MDREGIVVCNGLMCDYTVHQTCAAEALGSCYVLWAPVSGDGK